MKIPYGVLLGSIVGSVELNHQRQPVVVGSHRPVPGVDRLLRIAVGCLVGVAIVATIGS